MHSHERLFTFFQQAFDWFFLLFLKFKLDLLLRLLFFLDLSEISSLFKISTITLNLYIKLIKNLILLGV